MRRILLALMLLPMPLQADVYRGDPGITAGLAAAFGTTTEVVDSFLFPNHPDPAQASEAIGIIYPVIEGAAGNTSINAGVFTRVEGGYALTTPIEIFGHEPRNVQFLADRWIITTTMPKPSDPRCCPTGTTDWTIMRDTLQVVRNDR